MCKLHYEYVIVWALDCSYTLDSVRERSWALLEVEMHDLVLTIPFPSNDSLHTTHAEARFYGQRG